MDPATQIQFRDSRGLCDHHGWELARVGNALSIAVLYERALGELLDILNQHRSAGNGRMALGRLFSQNPNAALDWPAWRC
jgi:hypothetical protein